MLEKLKVNNGRLGTLADRLGALFASPEQPDWHMLAALRWEAASLAMRHMSMVDRFVLVHLASNTRPDIRDTVERFREDCIERIRRYADHAKQWPADRVEHDWQGFRRQASTQVELLRAVLDATRDTILPLACPIKSSEPMPLSRNWASEGQAVKQSVAPMRVPTRVPTAR